MRNLMHIVKLKHANKNKHTIVKAIKSNFSVQNKECKYLKLIVAHKSVRGLSSYMYVTMYSLMKH